jgi:hypothetical protein
MVPFKHRNKLVKMSKIFTFNHINKNRRVLFVALIAAVFAISVPSAQAQSLGAPAPQQLTVLQDQVQSLQMELIKQMLEQIKVLQAQLNALLAAQGGGKSMTKPTPDAKPIKPNDDTFDKYEKSQLYIKSVTAKAAEEGEIYAGYKGEMAYISGPGMGSKSNVVWFSVPDEIIPLLPESCQEPEPTYVRPTSVGRDSLEFRILNPDRHDGWGCLLSQRGKETKVLVSVTDADGAQSNQYKVRVLGVGAQ